MCFFLGYFSVFVSVLVVYGVLWCVFVYFGGVCVCFDMSGMTLSVVQSHVL